MEFKMKKLVIKRGLLGFPIGISIGYVITIIFSAIWAQGYYSAVTPELIQAMGNEINAVILQTCLCGIVGSGFAMASVVWNIEKWSIAKQSGIYFAIGSAIMLPIAYFANWMQHSVAGFLSYVGIFIGIFLFAWVILYFSWKAKIRKLNESVRRGSDAN